MTTPRVAIVTGSTVGIGLATARRLMADGHRVMFNSRSSAPPDAIASDLAKGQADFCTADVGLEADAAQLVSTTIDKWGRIDLLVNNAGTTYFIASDDFASVSEEVWHEMLSANLLSMWHTMKWGAPYLRPVRGAVVNVASVAGINATGSSIPYGVSKAGVIHLTKMMAKALAPDVRVNAVAPGVVRTRWHDRSPTEWETLVAGSGLGRAAEPEEIAEVICDVLDHSFITGEVVRIDGGQHL